MLLEQRLRLFKVPQNITAPSIFQITKNTWEICITIDKNATSTILSPVLSFATKDKFVIIHNNSPITKYPLTNK